MRRLSLFAATPTIGPTTAYCIYLIFTHWWTKQDWIRQLLHLVGFYTNTFEYYLQYNAGFRRSCFLPHGPPPRQTWLGGARLDTPGGGLTSDQWLLPRHICRYTEMWLQLDCWDRLLLGAGYLAAGRRPTLDIGDGGGWTAERKTTLRGPSQRPQHRVVDRPQLVCL